MKLGSLFDGIGGFPAVAEMYGIEATWASEVEPSCIRITNRHFPNMEHVGDITKLDGGKLKPVDIITGGSPCQSLSIAGNQDGIKLKCVECGTIVDFSDDADVCPKCGAELESTRSGLFLEQVRIIQEMREATHCEYPKVCVWENVCFSGDTLVTCDNGYKRIDAVRVGTM